MTYLSLSLSWISTTHSHQQPMSPPLLTWLVHRKMQPVSSHSIPYTLTKHTDTHRHTCTNWIMTGITLYFNYFLYRHQSLWRFPSLLSSLWQFTLWQLQLSWLCRQLTVGHVQPNNPLHQLQSIRTLSTSTSNLYFYVYALFMLRWRGQECSLYQHTRFPPRAATTLDDAFKLL